MALHAALQSATATGTSSTISKARSGASQVMPLQPAALLLIDRCEDLATPISAGAPLSTTFSSTSTSPIHAPFTAPLAHRILNTLNYCQYLSPPCIPSNNTPATGTGFSECNDVDLQQTQVDVILKAPILAEAGLEEVAELLGMSAPVAETCSERASADWNKPLSALTNLPLQLNPSLQYRHTAEGSASTDNTLLQRIMAGTEEQSKLTLCAEIKSRIEAEKGALPPNKKRGLGAEVLAFTQALINAPGSAHRSSTSNGDCAKAFDLACTNSESAAYKTYREDLSSTGLGYNYSVCLRSQPLLSLSLAVIEGMQRSSGKQFQQLCAWQCAYDVRTAREAEIGQMARKFEDFDICIAHLMSYFLPSKTATAAAVEAACESVGVASPGLKSKASASKLTAGAEKEKETAGPVDVVHVLIQLIRLQKIFFCWKFSNG